MKTFWKKTGWTCMSILPIIITLIIQFGIALVAMIGFEVYGMIGLGLTEQEASAYMLEAYNQNIGIVLMIVHGMFLLCFGIWYYFGCGRPKMCSPAKVLGGRCIPVVVILAFGMSLLSNAFVFLAQYIMPEAVEAFAKMAEAAGLGENILTIIASILIAPIGEELVCRGVVYHYAKKVVADMSNRRVAFWIANAIQALMFGVFHFNLIQGIYAFVIGLGLGWLRERYKSLYPAMLAHAVVNFVSTYVMEYPLSLVPETFVAGLVVLVVSVLICAGGIKLECTRKVENE